MFNLNYSLLFHRIFVISGKYFNYGIFSLLNLVFFSIQSWYSKYYMSKLPFVVIICSNYNKICIIFCFKWFTLKAFLLDFFKKNIMVQFCLKYCSWLSIFRARLKYLTCDFFISWSKLLVEKVVKLAYLYIYRLSSRYWQHYLTANQLIDWNLSAKLRSICSYLCSKSKYIK